MSVLVLGFASYPSALPDLGQDITNSQLTLGNVAFAQEEIEIELKEEIGISDVGETEEEIEEEEAEEEEEEEVELEGTITGLVSDGTSGFFFLDGDKIFFNADTEFDDLVASDLENDLEVKVEAIPQGDDFLATEIESEEEEVDAILATAEDEIKLKGTITGLVSDGTSGFFFLDGDKIFFNADTEFDDLVASDLENDLEVKVEAIPQGDDFLATEIELEEENGEDENGGPPGDKTKICHVPPGNPSKAHTITIGEPAANKHLLIHVGDYEGPCDGPVVSTAKGEIYVGEKQSESEARLAEKEARLADKQAEREARLAEKQMEFEARLAEKESQALQRAEELIQKLEQRITDLEQRLQTLLNKVETGEYFGNVPKIDPVLHSYSISIDGTASSLFDESVTTDVSGEIFIENLVTTSKVSKFKVTGGEIFVGDNIYDVVFGKARISSSGPSGEKDSMVLILQAIDSEGNTNTIRLGLNFGSALEGDFGTEPIELETVSNSKISGQWSLNVSGELSLL